MPANLPPDAKAKWNEVTLTRNPEERLRLMGEFISLVPKHKGTEKLCHTVKRQMAQLREDIDRRKKAAKRSGGPSYFIEKAGAAQIVIVGPTNAGRSSLLRAVSNSSVDVASWPYATRMPTPAMLPYEDIQFQLIEAPALVEGSSEGRFDGFQVLSLARNCDGLIIMVDLSSDPGGDYLMIARELANSRVQTVEPEGDVEITRRGYGSDIQFIWDGELVDTSTDEVKALLKDYKIRSALVRVMGRVTLDVVEDSIFGNAVYRPTMVIGNKADLQNSEAVIDSLRQAASPLDVMIISAEKTPELPQKLGSKLFDMLDIIRVYTKQPGKPAATEPIVARKRLTVGDLAKIIHTDFYKRFRYARLWGPSAKFDNERVGVDRQLADGDVVQFHA
ncbi:MAG TPA: GTPase [Patescibacteria group bacterium]|nr:GTPase [Patescibacteria group bacterium]